VTSVTLDPIMKNEDQDQEKRGEFMKSTPMLLMILVPLAFVVWMWRAGMFESEDLREEPLVLTRTVWVTNYVVVFSGATNGNNGDQGTNANANAGAGASSSSGCGSGCGAGAGAGASLQALVNALDLYARSDAPMELITWTNGNWKGGAQYDERTRTWGPVLIYSFQHSF
jgi:hypothetical protein